MSGFTDSILGGMGILKRNFIKSQNYVPGTSGWSINKNGTAEFRGVLIGGNNIVINSNGIFMYSDTPATGNLIIAIANTAGNDGLPGGGNAYGFGVTTQLPGGSSVSILQSGSIVNISGSNQTYFDGSTLLNTILRPKYLNPLVTGAIANSIAETVIGSVFIPLNDAKDNSGYRFRIYGGASTVLTPVLTLRFRLTNATGITFGTGYALTCRTAISLRFAVDGWVYISNPGASAILRCGGRLEESLVASAPADHPILSGDTTIPFDTGLNQIILCLTAQWSAASASNNAATFNGSIERIGRP